MQGEAGGAGAGQSGEQVSHAHTHQDCALALDLRRLVLQHLGPSGHLAPRWPLS